MKTIPPPCPEPDVGPKYWRSLEHLSDDPVFRQWVEREFPAGASELTDPVTRRNFMRIMSASFLLAGFGLSGCRRPVHHIYPFAKKPEGYVHGVPVYYATSMSLRGTTVPLLVKSHEGRPTKIEGNPDHPDSNGGTDHYVQASILDLYDPDRSMRFTKGGGRTTAQAAVDFLAQLSKQHEAGGGQGLSFLLERSTSPSRARLQQLIAQKYPQAKWHVYEPVNDRDMDRRIASQVFGRSVAPYYRLDEAKIILSLDCDFIGAEENAYIHCRRFAKGRKITSSNGSMNRLYAVEDLLTLTGSNADHRLRVPTSQVQAVAARLAVEVLQASGNAGGLANLQSLGQGAQPHEKWIVECAKDLIAHRGQVVVAAGQRQTAATHALAHAMNAALGAIGRTVVFREAPEAREGNMAGLVDDLNAGAVKTLFVLGGNPVYNAPADLNFAAAIAKTKPTVVRLGYYEDETFAVSDWHLPMAHYLESWGDGRTADGTYVSVQPLIEPLFGGLTELEVLARIGGLTPTDPYAIVRETFRAMGGDSEDAWKHFLHHGFLAKSAPEPLDVSLNQGTLGEIVGGAKAAAAPTKDALEVVFHRDYSVDDGRFNNNGWLQELPDPITKMTWENVILVSKKTAQELGLVAADKENNKLLVHRARLRVGGREVEGPVWIQPGQADYTVALALGYGRERTGRVGRSAGYNAYRVRISTSLDFATGGQLSPIGRMHQLATTQNHWSMEGRPIVREANLEQYRKHPRFAQAMDLEAPPGGMTSLYPNPLVLQEPSTLHQWGMSIDLNACVGCSACMVACQSENNIPIVGKEQVTHNREMHWLRIDRYYAGAIESPQVVNQPMLCQHCEKAPCENVCPVNATVHDHEGLNLMVYNRCVGTRYCSNNCPYKVRRFNFFDYNKRPLDQLYKSPITSFTDGEWELKRWFKNPDRPSRPEDEWELVKLVRNPDVSVRMRGVMEKCTFCVQRIEQAKIAVKVRAKDTPDVVVPEGAVKTACQQACPAEAIVFGNMRDPNSAVSKEKALERTYKVLEFLATNPRTTYLARVRNPNPAMPDHHEWPLTVREVFPKKTGDPFEVHPGAHGAAGEHGGDGGHGASRTKGGHAPAEKGAH